jgi:hypothetical protein
MPIYNETFAETWEKVDRINAAKKLLRENGYEVIDKVDQLQDWQKEVLKRLDNKAGIIELCNRDNAEQGIERD